MLQFLFQGFERSNLCAVSLFKSSDRTSSFGCLACNCSSIVCVPRSLHAPHLTYHICPAVGMFSCDILLSTFENQLFFAAVLFLFLTSFFQMFLVKTMPIFKFAKKANILLHLCRTSPQKVNDYISEKWHPKYVTGKYRQVAREAKLLIFMKNSEGPSKKDRSSIKMMYSRSHQNHQ